MSVTVCAIMMGIRTNLALSLGLVGALSIVRFRTAIKSGTDLIFLLIAISMGLISSKGLCYPGRLGKIITYKLSTGSR